MVTAAMIAQHFEAIIKDHPKMKLSEIQRRCATKMHDYANEIGPKTPESSIKMVVQGVTADSLPHFKRYYVCFDALRRGWKVGCRLLIGLDGCFLKGPLKSEFLATVGKDANNQMFPIAWVVVEVECTDSWTWLLSLLSTNLGLEDSYGYTIISDQQKFSKYANLSLDLEIAISDILPRVEHRNCVKHVFANWLGRKLGKSYECDF
ncbi:hypothetical protein Godav_027984, partial [Gossypium davidsonii]|nr:hypothetical protein [Gossypium davidsonii]MBA0654057.1 hypothetical protein [Gossypium klotzschianum]